MTIQFGTNHMATAVALLLEQFKRSANLINVVESFGVQLNDVEAMLQDYAEKTTVSTAEGAFLDIIGAIVGEERNQRIDSVYRDAIFVRIALNRGGGEIERIIQVVLLYAPSNIVEVHESFPAAIQVSVEYPLADPVKVQAAILAIKAAGVALLGVIESASETVDYTVADEAARLALIAPPLIAGDTVLQQDTGSIWVFLGGDPSIPANWELVGPPLIFFEDTGFGEGLADLTQTIGSNYVGGGVLGDLLA